MDCQIFALVGRLAMTGARSALPAADLMASVVGGSSDGLLVKDSRLRYLLVNAAAMEHLPRRMRPRQVLGHTARAFLPDAIARVMETADRAVMARRTTKQVEVSFAAPGRGMRVVSLRKSPWLDRRGRVIGVIATSRDVTEQRAAEQRERMLRSDAGRVEPLGAAGLLAAGLAHELSQPLAAATAFLDTAGRLMTSNPARAATVMRDAAGQVRRAADVVRSLRRLMAEGGPALRVENVAELLTSLPALAREELAISGCRLLLDVAPDIGRSALDRIQVEQVLINLVRNASEAMAALPAGAPRDITVRGWRDTARNRVVIRIADTGPGIDAAIAQRLFRPFISSKPGGLGIGLALCRSIIEAHDGQLTIEPTQGGGAVFVLTLPGAWHEDAAL